MFTFENRKASSNWVRDCCRNKQMLINKFLLVFQQPAIDESFPIKFRELLMVFWWYILILKILPCDQYGPCHEALKATVKCQYFLRESVTMIFPCVNWDNNTQGIYIFYYIRKVMTSFNFIRAILSYTLYTFGYTFGNISLVGTIRWFHIYEHILCQIKGGRHLPYVGKNITPWVLLP